MGKDHAQKVASIKELGFTDKQAEAALKQCNGNLEQAIDSLFTNASSQS